MKRCQWMCCVTPAHPRKTLHESTKILSVGQDAVCCCDTGLNPGLMIIIRSRALDATGSVITIGLLSINWCSHSENQFDKRKQDWLVQKFELRQPQMLDAVQVEDKNEEALLTGWWCVIFLHEFYGRALRSLRTDILRTPVITIFVRIFQFS